MLILLKGLSGYLNFTDDLQVDSPHTIENVHMRILSNNPIFLALLGNYYSHIIKTIFDFNS